MTTGKRLTAILTLGDFEFKLGTTNKVSTVVASFGQKGGEPLQVDDLIDSLGILDSPASTGVGLDRISLVYQRDNRQFLCAADVGVELDFVRGLPLVGEPLAAVDEPLKATLSLLYASGRFSQDDVVAINTDVGRDNLTLPQVLIKQGLSLNVSMTIEGVTEQILLPLATSNTNNARTIEAGVVDEAVAPAAEAPPQVGVQRTFGPVAIQKINFENDKGELAIRISASLTLAGLTLSLLGLKINTPLDNFAPVITDLDGIGVTFDSGGVTIDGTLLYDSVNDAYAGRVVLRFSKFSITALGAYTTIDGKPSFLIYAVLDFPLGGPPFAYVTGLSIGFGYNRRLVPPTLDEVTLFPLVAAALDSPGAPQDLGELAAVIDTFIPVSSGDLFLAAGLKFTSFKLADSFALLTINLSDPVTVGLYGISQLSVPPLAPNPILQVEMVFAVSYDFGEGALKVEAALTDASYLFSPDCKLSGGFAFYSWFKGRHAGDFVFSIGGYHPRFAVPAHYPSVTPLGFSWQLNPFFSIKGSMYFALTPIAIMAGGAINAVYDFKAVEASLSFSMDMILYWKPLYYEIDIRLDIRAKVDLRLWTQSVSLSANLFICGPEFSGIATFKVVGIKVEITFGADKTPAALPIDWSEFQTSFLPDLSSTANDDNQVININVQQGLLTTVTDEREESVFIVDAESFVLTTHSTIPSSEAQYNDGDGGNAAISLADTATDNFGIAPMDVQNPAVTQTITITSRGEDRGNEFAYTPLTQNMPKGLWGERFTPNIREQESTLNLLSGFAITPANSATPDATQTIPAREFSYDIEFHPSAYDWDHSPSFTGSGEDAQTRFATLLHDLTRTATGDARSSLLASLGYAEQTDVDLFDLADDPEAVFLVAPEIVA